jgi:hypothetical protein
MRNLADIQKDFLDSIMNGDAGEAGLNTTSGPSGGGKFSAAAYRDLVATNHLNTLKDVYPVCQRLVGEGYFSFLAWNYLKDRPTDDPDLNRYGVDFPDFLEQEARVRDELTGLGYLPSVSRFEWALYAASRKSAAAVPFEEMVSKLTHLGDKDTVFFRLNPSLSLMEFNSPVVRIWEENRREEVGQIALDGVREYVVVWKSNGDVLYKTVDGDAYGLLMLVREGVPLYELNRIYGNREQELERLVAQSISSGWIADVEIG